MITLVCTLHACGWLRGAAVHTLASVRASPALMAAIIKKAFKAGCATKEDKVGVVLGCSEWESYLPENTRKCQVVRL